MRIIIKVILIFGIIIIGGVLISFIKAATGRASNSPGVGGPIGIIVGFALLAGITAIWKYNPKKSEDNTTDENDRHLLNKE